MNFIDFFELIFNPIFSKEILFLVFFLFLLLTYFSVVNKISNSLGRLIVLLIFSLIVLQPSIKIEKRKVQKSILTFVIDKTDSQKISSRTDINNKIYMNILDKIASEREFFDILEITVDNEKYTKKFGSIDKIKDKNIKPTVLYHNNKSSTELYNYFLSELNKFPVKKISSIFFFTDGQIHDSNDGWFKKQFDVPTYFIVPKSNLLNDLRLDIESYPEYVEVDEEIEVNIKVSVFGKNNQKEMKINVFGSSGNSQIINVKNDDLVKIKLKIDRPGDNYFVINLPSSEGEATISNNQKLIKVNASRKKLKVLLISGEPYLGTRVWRNFLKSDPAVELIHMTVLRPPEKIDEIEMEELSLIPFPVKELFEEKIDNFNLVIFDNFKGKNILTPLYFQNLVNFVENGGAILEITGPSYNSRSSLFRTEIGKILPGIPTGKSLRGQFKPVLTELGKKHPITKSLFQGYERYGDWYEMNQVRIDQEDTSVLMTGIEETPLLSIKKIDKGRIAQIYSHHIWLWKNISSDKGPYKKLIKNLAHWLMQEPQLEADKLIVSGDEKFLYIEKQNFKSPHKTDDEIFIYNPKGQKKILTLNKTKKTNSNEKFSYYDQGYYLISNKSIVKTFMTPGFSSKENSNLNINENLLQKIRISGDLTKVVKTKNGTDFNIEKVNRSELTNLSSDKIIYLPLNYQFRIKEIRKIELFNRTLLFILIVILLVFTWRKENIKKGPNPKIRP